ncbi:MULTISPECIES: type 1 glutamine amidotransferase [Dictyoglomus]|jgi:CobQ-like glutamine amidotransferase family enzyme|uniref:Lipid II isoglutaminyl synthase (glutamine-hydrolyzing) subunit GatD n=1 Tax=Dictyoglomus turgidum (strain DSM 6724 / Z-1310) TaxID=515635 RepID=B8DYH1_DICTD|nr:MULTISPECIES: glutamine amidotransferase [Dictyoglomus]ACK41353.1 CobB/CobQ domain protein glutamine amidotransferase [Dictyoglomus turgidum DSM 6724]PNV79165.1 MAG: glutamine amidotransferase [Dictyoglomus turgidum]HBU31642.1 glutamine amidotransferase [Dictyoglomus sp.]
MELKIYHMYPDLLNLYGDRGNIIVFERRLKWRGIKADIVNFTRDDEKDLEDADIIFLGGGSDREQEILYSHLFKFRSLLKDMVEDGACILAVCGGYQLLGRYYLDAYGNKIEGLSILDFYTRAEKGRLIGNILIESNLPLKTKTIVGFENHGGRTYHDYEPLGRVMKGFGNNGKDEKEGLVYKNLIGTYLHGPILSKNPHLADYIIKKALERKYKKEINLPELNDCEEMLAHERVKKKILREGKLYFRLSL